MPIEAVLLDMDGVVVDNLPYHVDAWLLFCEQHGIPLTREVFYRELNGMNSKDTFEWFYGREMSREEIEHLEEKKEAIYRNFYADHRVAAPGLIAFLTELQEQGIACALATSAGQGNIDFIVDGLGIRHFFQAIVGGAEVKKGKPDPEIYMKAADLLGANYAHCWVVEDSLQGIQAGLSAGMQVVGITTSHSASELARTQIQAPNFEGLLGLIQTKL
ncbi:HAD family hydrolase [Aquirufa aurantiipilula]|uniref:HAD family phosphatase n=1 Tax=Aquirufa aurantiipilula TaxID=2696561 RepID=A0ABT6BIZ8_9BACT|nr:HAD family phosphatase [Aquirufa aurantiipilula]MDF5690442.1 HAD family phosphatase [Aquirufa aurantiipilula]